MADSRVSPLPRASSEPDLTALPQLYTTDLQLEFTSVAAAGTPELPGITLAPTNVASNTQPLAVSVSFSEYVATELARTSTAPPPTPAIGGVPVPSLDLERFLAPDGAPHSPRRAPRSPRRSPHSPRITPAPAAGSRARSFDADRADDWQSDSSAPDDANSSSSSHVFFAHAQRQVLLKCMEINMKGEMKLRELTRSEILAESRETLHKAHPSMSDAAMWMRELDTRGAGTPEMESFAVLMDARSSGLTGASRQAREGLRNYLRNYLRNSLQPRDIRQVDPAFAAKPALWIRHTALVVSMERVRAIIFRSKLLLFEPDSMPTQRAADIARGIISARGADGGAPGAAIVAPFERRALEGILIAVLGELEADFFRLKPTIAQHLKDLPHDLTTQRLEELRLDKQRLSLLRSRTAAVHDILEKVLDEDEDMANMYLTEKHASPELIRSAGDHDEVEMLLEAYLQGVDELVNQGTLLSDGIEDTEDLVMIHLDTLRNRLLTVELALSVVSMTFAVGGVISGIFGMNLPIAQFDEGASTYWFAGVTLAIIVMVIVLSWVVLRILKMRGLYSFH